MCPMTFAQNVPNRDAMTLCMTCQRWMIQSRCHHEVGFLAKTLQKLSNPWMIQGPTPPPTMQLTSLYRVIPRQIDKILMIFWSTIIDLAENWHKGVVCQENAKSGIKIFPNQRFDLGKVIKFWPFSVIPADRYQFFLNNFLSIRPKRFILDSF